MLVLIADWSASKLMPANWLNRMTNKPILNSIARELLEVVKTGAVDRATMIADGCTNYWSFLNSYYFAGTVVTTLGYGNVYPATNPGKVLFHVNC